MTFGSSAFHDCSATVEAAVPTGRFGGFVGLTAGAETFSNCTATMTVDAIPVIDPETHRTNIYSLATGGFAGSVASDGALFVDCTASARGNDLKGGFYYNQQPYSTDNPVGSNTFLRCHVVDSTAKKVRRVLRLFYRTNMQRNKPFGFLCSESHYEAARKIAEEGIVLLKNRPLPSSPKGEGLLPLTAEKLLQLHAASPYRGKEGVSILVVGENAIKMMTVGGGSSSLKVQHEILPLDGLTRKSSMFNVQCSIDYARGYVGDTIQSFDGVSVGRSLYDNRTAGLLVQEAVEKAKQADVVIFFGGLNKAGFQDSEGHDRKLYDLPYGQSGLIKALLEVNPRLVYVNISGNPVPIPHLDKIPAVVQAWFLGSEAGTAIASVLFGDVNPSGKLPYTWYASLGQCGAHATGSYPGTWREGHQIIDEEYKEDIFVGYRWTDRLKKEKPMFAFGHGLSYTTFKISNAKADKKRITSDETVTFTVDVTNMGSMAGAETVQLYIRDLKSSLPRPVKELKGFSKVYLAPGATQQVSITIDKSALSFYDDRVGEWVAEPGDFEALIGTASDKITSAVKFSLTAQ